MEMRDKGEPGSGAGAFPRREPSAGEQTTEEEAAFEPSPDPMAALETDLAEARAEAERCRESWYRAAADLENVRKRTARELEEGGYRARAEVLLEVLGVLDDLDRALAASGGEEGAEAGRDGKMPEPAGAVARGAGTPGEDPIVTGLRLIRARIEDLLRRQGVVEIPAAGEVFDPQVHDAVMQLESAEVPGGHVAQVLERGYLLGDRVLRPARVVVAMERS
jgi:molecular chaperone GrpE